jgi:hypothetical protein
MNRAPAQRFHFREVTFPSRTVTPSPRLFIIEAHRPGLERTHRGHHPVQVPSSGCVGPPRRAVRGTDRVGLGRIAAIAPADEGSDDEHFPRRPLCDLLLASPRRSPLTSRPPRPEGRRRSVLTAARRSLRSIHGCRLLRFARPRPWTMPYVDEPDQVEDQLHPGQPKIAGDDSSRSQRDREGTEAVRN